MDEVTRVAHLGPDPAGPGGMPAVVRDLLQSPLRERFAMKAITTYRPVGSLEKLRIFGWSLVTTLRWCLGPGPRLLHVHGAVRGSAYRKSAYILIATLTRRPVVLHMHAGARDIRDFVGGLGRLRRAVLRAVYRRAGRRVTVSRAGAAELARAFGGDWIVVPNAAPPVPAAAAALRTPDGRVRIAYLGGFEDPAKGGALLVASLALTMSACPAAEVTLAGPGEPSPLERREIEASGRARWVGWLDRGAKEALLESSDIVAFPSTSEGLPVALLEAMAYARAIVATAVGGMPEVLDDRTEARFIPPGDAPALAKALGELCADPDERGRLGRSARARAERLNANDVCARLEGIYRELLAESPTRSRRAARSGR